MRSVLFAVVLIFSLSSCEKNNDVVPGPPDPPPVLPDTLTQGWSAVYSEAQEYFMDIFFADEVTGYCAGNGILKTNNGGLSWTSVRDTSYSENIAAWGNNKVVFTNRLRPALQSQNNGLTFNPVIASSSTVPIFTDSWFINADTCYFLSLNAIWRSVNGGITADSIYGFPGGEGFGLLFFLPGGQTGWASRAATLGGTFKTSDGGLTWSRVNNIYSFQHYINATIGFTVQGRNILKTVDGGQNFATIYTHNLIDDLGFLNDIHFVNDNVGYAVIGKHLLKTTDGGNSWETVVRSSNGFIREIHFVNEDHGWAVTGRTILRFAQ